ncbi:MAG: protein kinase [Planctomycetota bacterium]
MIHQAQSDRLDDAIDEFEDTWSSESRLKIETLLQRHGLAESDEAIAELIRIDIELRYENGLATDLEDYFGHFGTLLESPHRVAEIAFEDYRSRSAKGHSLAASRWSALPGIADQSWFRQLASETRSVPQRRFMAESDEAFETALAESGFQLVEEIGSGNFSHVYLATQQNLSDRFVVLKIVAEALTEPESMAMLQHTNIVPIFSFHQFRSRSVICMPYAGRVTLADFLQRRNVDSGRTGESLVMTVKASLSDTKVVEASPSTTPLPLIPAADEHAGVGMLDRFEGLDCGDLATWIFQRLAGALAHSHARGVLHNDLKPSNVLIRNDGEPALLDFNLSHSLSGQTPRRVGGTLPYMSPETFRAMMGMPGQPESHSDIYSLGVMMYEFVTGRLPYPKPTSIADTDLQAAVEARRTPLAWEPTDDVSPGMRAIIAKCVAFEEGQRYRSADQLQSDLQAEHESRPLQHAAEPAVYRCQKWIRRHPRGITGAIVATALLAIMIPLGIAASTYQAKSKLLASLNDYESFYAASTEVLSELMADPTRERDDRIRTGMEPLERFGIFEDGGIEHLLSHCMSDDKRLQVSQSIQRHVAHLGFLETNRLSRLRAIGELEDSSFRRLDKLIRYAERFEGSGERAKHFLRAERARLAEDTKTYLALTDQAESIRTNSDSDDYLEAVRLMSKRDFESAAEILTGIADRRTVPSALRWTMIGQAQYRQEKHAEAALSFSQSIDHAKNSPTLHMLRGLAYLQIKGRGERAKRDFLKTVQLDPDHFRAWLHLAIIAEGRKEYRDALESLEKSLELFPDNPHALIVRARVYRGLGEVEKAEADFDAAMKSNNVDYASLINRATARANHGDPEAALEDLTLALEMEPERPTVQMQIARLLAIDLRRYDESIAMYDRVLGTLPKHETALVDQAVLFAYQKKFGAALQNLDAAQPIDSARNKYQAACIFALMNTEKAHRRALSLLAAAILGGYVPKNLSGDPDLKSLHSFDDFQIISRTLELLERNRRRGQAAIRGSASLRLLTYSQPLEID